mmetsp:Transcript_6135/g.9448  ORF Transcript_6135/g.9448 Transcript_6135/m.9448 type:complete len:99 (-) Transcript_6135:365-661(-)
MDLFEKEFPLCAATFRALQDCERKHISPVERAACGGLRYKLGACVVQTLCKVEFAKFNDCMSVHTRKEGISKGYTPQQCKRLEADLEKCMDDRASASL